MTTAPHLDLAEPVSETDHVAGPAAAPVTLVEYGDFECLHCGRAYPILRELRGELPETLRLVFRHFPMGWEHPHAAGAAKAAEAAARQGRFWAMHDELYEHQRLLDPDALRAHAEVIGLDLAQFDRDIHDPAVAARVQRDLASGRSSGVRGTPTFFLNGVRYGDPWDLDALRAAIAGAAAEARGGTP